MKNIQNILNTKFREKQQFASDEFNQNMSNRHIRRMQQRKRKEFDIKMSIGITQTMGDKYWYNSLSEDTKNTIYSDWNFRSYSNENYKSKIFNIIPNSGQEKKINDFFKNFCKLKYESIKPNKLIYRENKINDILNG